MSFFNSIKNNSKKYETPFDHWEYSNALSEGAIEEIVKAASEIIELESHVTTIFSDKANADKYAFLSTFIITV